jgi:hypothetical protein
VVKGSQTEFLIVIKPSTLLHEWNQFKLWHGGKILKCIKWMLKINYMDIFNIHTYTRLCGQKVGNMVCKLLKSLYDLRLFPYAWNNKVNTYFLSERIEYCSTNDVCKLIYNLSWTTSLDCNEMFCFCNLQGILVYVLKDALKIILWVWKGCPL